MQCHLFYTKPGMNIIEGSLPTKSAWRALVLLSSEIKLGRTWQLSYSLVKANQGQLIAAVIINSLHESKVDEARKIIKLAQKNIPDTIEFYPIIVVTLDLEETLHELVDEAEIDLLLLRFDSNVWHNINKIPCAIAAVRGDKVVADLEKEPPPLSRILVPTAGGPNTAYALNYLLPLTPEIEVKVVCISQSHSAQEDALGRQRLRQMINFVDGSDRLTSDLITAASVSQGIVEEAAKSYDLVILGASRESSIDKVLFGDIPGAVVRQSRTPVVLVRQPKSRFVNLSGQIMWFIQGALPRMNVQERSDAYIRIRRSARPKIDFFVLIGLSALIAALGLIISSPAVVIGAMLVAPLMSPIVGTGLAAVLGDIRFLKLAITTTGKGVLLAILLGMAAGLLHLNQPLTPELMARTQPTLIDLAIALFSGLAGAFAICRSDAAGALPGVAIAAALVPPLATVGITLVDGDFRSAFGSMLLFTTNFVAISAATAIMFLILGFRPSASQKDRRELQHRTVQAAIMMVGVVAVLLVGFTFLLARDSQKETAVIETVEQQLALMDAELNEIPEVVFSEEEGVRLLSIDIVARSITFFSHAKSVELQENIGIALEQRDWFDKIVLKLTVIEVKSLDPLAPPPATPTAVPTRTAIPAP